MLSNAAAVSAVSLLTACAVSVTASHIQIAGAGGQAPLASPPRPRFRCDLPPRLEPSDDGLPAAADLFSSREALLKQVERHQAIVRVPSICYDDLGEFDEDERWEPFYDVHRVLEETYPAIYERALVEKVNRFGLVYTVQGSDETLKPILLTAHQDVVPVADESTWTYPPFEAHFDGEWLWGRGSSDDKNSLTALLSAVEAMVSVDWTPRRTIILAFGFDEECHGRRGAARISEFLTERYGDDGIAVILDEGGLGQMEVGDVKYALPGVTEKATVDIWFQLHANGGHSSAPTPHTGIGIMAEIVETLEAHPFEPQVIKDSPVYNHMVCLARYTPHASPEITRAVRRGDLDGLTRGVVGFNRHARYLVQTSQAVDYIAGGQKINALPEVVTLGVNHRIAPQDGSPAAVQHRAVKVIQSVVDKYDITVRAFEDDDEYNDYVAQLGPDTKPAGHGRHPRDGYEVDYNATLILTAGDRSNVVPVSPTSGPVWDVFSGTIQNTLAWDGEVVPVGQTMNGNTDTRHYMNLTPHVYRWTPNAEGTEFNIHTVDERVLMSDHLVMVQFYYDYIRNMDAANA